MSKDISDMFNYILEKKDLPDIWTTGIRSAIHKTGPKLDTNNYRGVTIFPIFEKFFEISVQKRLEFVSDAFNMTDRYNGGFLKGSRTTDNIFTLNALIERQLALGQNLIVCHVDF